MSTAGAAPLILASIPSPSQGVWHIGPFPLRAYAFCIIAGAIVGIWIGNRRWVARGGKPGQAADVACWAVPFGLVGARLYHVITDYQDYFGAGGHPIDALKIWHGGLGIWGAVALGAFGAWIGCRRNGIKLSSMADSLAPGVVIAQAIGRWGNWFNQELFGRPTSLPWGLEIDVAHRPPGYLDQATYHPTFLYESIWCVGVAILCIWADRRFTLGHGRVFALYVFAYTIGRGWIEDLRIDPAHHIGPFRLNVWVSIIVCIGAAVAFVLSARRHPGREVSVYRDTEPVEVDATPPTKAGAPLPD